MVSKHQDPTKEAFFKSRVKINDMIEGMPKERIVSIAEMFAEMGDVGLLTYMIFTASKYYDADEMREMMSGVRLLSTKMWTAFLRNRKFIDEAWRGMNSDMVWGAVFEGILDAPDLDLFMDDKNIQEYAVEVLVMAIILGDNNNVFDIENALLNIRGTYSFWVRDRSQVVGPLGVEENNGILLSMIKQKLDEGKADVLRRIDPRAFVIIDEFFKEKSLDDMIWQISADVFENHGLDA